MPITISNVPMSLTILFTSQRLPLSSDGSGKIGKIVEKNSKTKNPLSYHRLEDFSVVST